MTTPNPGPATQTTKTVILTLSNAGALKALPFLQSSNFYNSPAAQLGSTPNWIKLTEALPYSVFSVAAGSANTNLCSLPGGAIVHGIKIKHSVAFTGGAIAAYTISVGTVANPTLLASAFNVFGAPTSTNLQLSSNFYEFDEVNSTTLIAQAIASGANLNAATTGIVDIYALLSSSF